MSGLCLFPGQVQFADTLPLPSPGCGVDGFLSVCSRGLRCNCWVSKYLPNYSLYPSLNFLLNIKFDSVEVKISVHVWISALLFNNFRICWLIQLNLARINGLEVLNTGCTVKTSGG